MSAFLGHIHYWLYRKIRLLYDREAALLALSNEEYDDLGDELYETARSMYGEPLPADVPLEDMIDHSNIHGWLHSQIATAEVREATFIKDLTDCLSDDGAALVNKVFYEHGKSCGEQAKDELPSEDCGSIYQIMQNYYLNGMPCDGGDQVVAQSPQQYAWIGSHRNQVANWEKAGVPLPVMDEAYRNWFKGFAEGTACGARFEVNDATNPPIFSIVK